MPDNEIGPIKEFSINKLHGERNIKITFNSYVKILVSENGYGKTTVLNSLFAILYGNYGKLGLINFESISLIFNSGKSITLQKSDFLPKFDEMSHGGILQHLRTFLSDEILGNLYEDLKKSRNHLKASPTFALALKEMQKKQSPSYDESVLFQWLDILHGEIGNRSLYNDTLNKAREIIQEEFPYDPIYLPTYRRIEEDLKNLTTSTAGFDISKTVIQFGMTDVEASFNEITAEIKNSTIEWFAKINGQMLGQLIKGFELTDAMKASLDDKEALKIVIERIGDNMPSDVRENILGLIESKTILNGNYQALAYFLSNLVKIYEQQRTNDNAIKQFTEICNKYLTAKKVFYDESSVRISIIRTKNNQSVSINTLSSGEKQIISLFSRLFLTKSKKVAIFFDEPELSLSIEWQKSLLPDILQSGICGFLFCTTHSPFIFENDLTLHTTDLSNYIEEL